MMGKEACRVGSSLTPQSMTEWITDRQPTEADSDNDGDVMAKIRPDSESFWTYQHWSWVAEGQPWKPVNSSFIPVTPPEADASAPEPTAPAPRKVVQIISCVDNPSVVGAQGWLHALCEIGRAHV